MGDRAPTKGEEPDLDRVAGTDLRSNHSRSTHLIDSRGHPAQSEKSLQLQDVEVGHTDALHLPRGLQGFHPLKTQQQ